MTTKQLAKQLGLIRRSSKLSLNCKNGSSPKSKQFFQYLIIIDFESTCWKDMKHYGQEIIEFPAVLLNTSSGEIESEFHTYVQPQEHPILSEFCTELTGIKQQQVDDGVPLKICLSQFSSWIKKLQNERGIIFPNVLPNQSCPEQKMCAFVTWSDWDLGVCLLYECKRKQLRKPEILNSWIDLRLTYKLFYNRKPKGLNGALQDVGIEFSGREHSGLDDSRNTARLAWRMICDGCVMKITKSLEKVQPCKSSEQTGMVFRQASGSGQRDGNQIVTVGKDDQQDLKRNPTSEPSDTTSDVKRSQFSPPNKITNKIGGREDDILGVDVYAPQNLLNGLSTTLLGYGNKYRYTNQNSFGSLQNRRQTGTFTSTPANHAPHCPSHVLFSTTIVSVNDVSALEVDSSSDLSILADWEEAAVIADSQEEQRVSSAKREESVPLPVESLAVSVSRLQNDQNKLNLQAYTKSILCHPSTLHSKSVVYKSPDTTIYNVSLKKQVCNSSTFKLPTAPNKPGVTPQTAKKPSKSTSLLDCFPKRKLSRVGFSSPPKKLPFTIHEDQRNQTLPFVSGPSRKVPHKVLNSTVNLSINNRSAKVTSITAPMCNCGRRAKKLTVSNGGPNQGRVFYSCAIRKRDDDGKGCSYFKWEDTLLKEKSLNSSSILSTSGISFTSNTSLVPSTCSETHKTFKLRPSLRT